MVQWFNMWMVLAVTGAVLATLTQCDSSVDTPLDNNVFPGSNDASVAIGGGLKLQSFGKPIVRLDNEGGGLVALGYPKESPNIPFTYPSISTTSRPTYSSTIKGYPRESPINPLTYTTPQKTSTTQFITKTRPTPIPTINIGYHKVTPSNPFTYPTSRITYNTHGPTQTTTKQTFFTNPRPANPTVLVTGYPKVTPSNPFTYPITRYTFKTLRPTQSTTIRPIITTTQATRPSTIQFITTPTIIVTGYHKVSPSNTFTYPTTRFTFTTPRPTQSTTIRPIITTTAPTRSSTIQFITTPRPTQPTTIVTGYPKVSPSNSSTYPTILFTFTTPRPTQSTTIRPIITTSGPIRSTTIQQFITTPRPTQPTTVVTGYPKVSPSNPFTYPTTRFTFTTPRPTQSTTIRPIITTSGPIRSTTIQQLITTPRPTQPTTVVTGYPKVSPSNPFTYPTTRFTFTTPRPTQSTTTRPIITTTAPTRSSTIQFITTPRPTQPTTIVTGYPKVSPSNPFTYPTTRFTFTTPRPTQSTTTRPIITTTAPTRSSTIQFITTPRPTQPTTIVTGYPKVSPSNPFTYPTTRFTFTTPRPTQSTTIRPIITTSGPIRSTTIQQFITTPRPTQPPTIVTGYPKVSPSNPFTYPTTRFTFTTPRPTQSTTIRPIITTTAPTRSSTIQFITTPRPTQPTTIVTGYPKVSPSNPFTYPTTKLIHTTRKPTESTTNLYFISTPKPTQPPTTLVGYPKFSPNNPLIYPTSLVTGGPVISTDLTTERLVGSSSRPDQTIPAVTGYPRIVPVNPFTYPSRLIKRNAVIGSISGNGSGGVMRQERLFEPEISSSRVVRQDDGQYRPSEHGEAAHDDPNHWDIRKSVPGEPGEDYPVLTSIPETAFTCYGREEGYHADLETGCQVFHVCSKNSEGVKNSFLCPNGSIFNQQLSTCDWWKNVDCNGQVYSGNVLLAEVGTKQPRVTYATTPRVKQSNVLTTQRPIVDGNNLFEGGNAVESAERNTPSTPASLPPYSLVPPISEGVANQPNNEEDIGAGAFLSDQRYSTTSRPLAPPVYSNMQPEFVHEYSNGNAHISNGLSLQQGVNVESPITTVKPAIQYTPSKDVNSNHLGTTLNNPVSVTTSVPIHIYETTSTAVPEYSTPVTTKLFIQDNDGRGYNYEPAIDDFSKIAQGPPQISTFDTGSRNIASPVQTPNYEYSVKLTDLLNPEHPNGKVYPGPGIESVDQNLVTISTTPRPFSPYPSQSSSQEVSFGTTTVAPGIASSLLPPVQGFIQPEFIPRGFSHQPPRDDFNDYRGSISTHVNTVSSSFITKSPFEYLPPQSATEDAISSLLVNKPAPGDVSTALLGQVDIRENDGFSQVVQQPPANYNTYKGETSSQLHAIDQNAVKIFLSSESPIQTLNENSAVAPVEPDYQINHGAQNSYASSFAEYNPRPQEFSNIFRNSPIPVKNINEVVVSSTPSPFSYDLSQNSQNTVSSTSKPLYDHLNENLNIANGFIGTLVSSTPHPLIVSSSEGNSHLVTSTPVPLSESIEGAGISSTEKTAQGNIGTISSNLPLDNMANNKINGSPYRHESNGQINVQILPSVDMSQYKYSPHNGDYASPLQIQLPTEGHSNSQGVLIHENVYQGSGLDDQPRSDVSQRSNAAIPVEQPEILRSVSFDLDTPEGRKEFESAVASGLFREGRSTIKEQSKEDVNKKTESS